MAKIYGYGGPRLAVIGTNALAVPFTGQAGCPGSNIVSPPYGQKVRATLRVKNTGQVNATGILLVRGFTVNPGWTLNAESGVPQRYSVPTIPQSPDGKPQGKWFASTSPQDDTTVGYQININLAPGTETTDIILYSGSIGGVFAGNPISLDVIWRINLISGNTVLLTQDCRSVGAIVVPPQPSPQVTISNVTYSLA